MTDLIVIVLSVICIGVLYILGNCQARLSAETNTSGICHGGTMLMICIN